MIFSKKRDVDPRKIFINIVDDMGKAYLLFKKEISNQVHKVLRSLFFTSSQE